MSGLFAKLFGNPRPGGTARAKGGKKKDGTIPATREEQIRKMQSSVDAAMTPERRALIENAMKIRQSKAKILDDLGDEQKRKLYALAIKSMIGQDPDAKK